MAILSIGLQELVIIFAVGVVLFFLVGLILRLRRPVS